VFEVNPQLTDWRRDLFDLIESCTHLDWLLLTKRPENLHDMMPARWSPHRFARPPRHVWFGISAENQEEFNSRWPVLEHFGRLFGAANLFISAEPLLGPIDMEIALKEEHHYKDDRSIWIHAADWVIVGGESGPKARPMHPDWARSIRDQCVEAGVPFHFKQWGEWAPFTTPPPGRWENLLNDDRPDPNDTSERRFRVGRGRAGRVLDDRCGRVRDDRGDHGMRQERAHRVRRRLEEVSRSDAGSVARDAHHAPALTGAHRRRNISAHTHGSVLHP